MRMRFRFTPSLLFPVALFGAITLAILAERTPSSAAPAQVASPEPKADAVPVDTAALPPGHPSVPGMGMSMGIGMGGHGPHGGSAVVPNGDNQAPAAIDWKPPSSWTSLPNPNPMRLATYKVTEATELSVARAGGTVDANVERWSAQFESAPKIDRRERDVRGVKVTIIRIGGTFLGNGMAGGAADKREGWSMLAAIAQSVGSPYFFKLVGPSDQIDRARAGFDALVDSITPRTTP
jgi:hypothetical protein